MTDKQKISILRSILRGLQIEIEEKIGPASTMWMQPIVDSLTDVLEATK